YRVAICEQMADPAEVKGLVPRDVVRVVTAGTVTADQSLEAEAPNYLGALIRQRGGVAVALADITTGEVRLASGSEAELELLRGAPAELLLEDMTDRPDGFGGQVVVRPQLSDLAVESELARQFGEHARSGLVHSHAEGAALAHLVCYLRETYAAALGSFQRVRHVADARLMTVDARTLRNLDVFGQPGRTSSLFGVLNRSKSAMGGRLLREWLSHPLREPEPLARRHDAVAWAATHPLERERAQDVLHGMPDVGRLLGKVGARSAGPRDRGALRTGLRACLELGSRLPREGLPAFLDDALHGLAESAEALATLDAALDDDPPHSFDEGGVIRPGFSPEIDSLRALTRDARGFLLGLERLERERSGIKTLKVGHNKVFGYYIEVSAANAALVPDHYQRRQTLVGAERYVTEELKEHESRLVGARDRLVELEKAAFAQLIESLAAVLGQLQAVAEAIARIDLALGLGEIACEAGYVRPEFVDGRVHIQDGRHPVVEAALGPGRFV
ncbi:MAG TPA: hypothetical protein PKD27_14265, partial [Tepidiformaceae bacterium]|nr:hypothetical protein [Tepidiformaceae bacterium]